MRVLLIGETPETADLSDPAIPPGLTVEKIYAGTEQSLSAIRDQGWEPVVCEVSPQIDEAVTTLRSALAGGAFDCAILGGGLRLPASRVELFERVINLLRMEAPNTALGFNTGPETTAEAVKRVTKG